MKEQDNEKMLGCSSDEDVLGDKKKEEEQSYDEEEVLNQMEYSNQAERELTKLQNRLKKRERYLQDTKELYESLNNIQNLIKNNSGLREACHVVAKLLYYTKNTEKEIDPKLLNDIKLLFQCLVESIDGTDVEDIHDFNEYISGAGITAKFTVRNNVNMVFVLGCRRTIRASISLIKIDIDNLETLKTDYKLQYKNVDKYLNELLYTGVLAQNLYKEKKDSPQETDQGIDIYKMLRTKNKTNNENNELNSSNSSNSSLENGKARGNYKISSDHDEKADDPDQDKWEVISKDEDGNGDKDEDENDDKDGWEIVENPINSL